MTLLQNFLGSIVKFAQDEIAAYRTASLSTNLAFINLDAHADIHDIPQVDLLGITGFASDVQDRIHSVSVAFGLMTYEDPNLFRHYAMLGRLHERLQPEKQISLYDATTASRLSWMVVQDGTAVLPMTRAEVRSLQFVQVNFLVDPYATSQ